MLYLSDIKILHTYETEYGFTSCDYEIEYEVKKPHDYIETFNKILSKIEKEYVENSKSKYKRFLESMEGEQV